MTPGLKLNLVLAAAIVVCILQIRGGGRDLSQPNVVYMPDMAYSKAAESFTRNPVFRSGITLQVPPDGTIARGSLPVAAAHPDSAVVDSAGSPAPLDAQAAARGATEFRRYCQPCHGASGRGDGPVAQRGYPPPPTLLRPESRAISDEQMFGIITSGQKNMPGHGKMIAVEDRWKIVQHVRTLQAPAPATVPAVTDSASTGGGGS